MVEDAKKTPEERRPAFLWGALAVAGVVVLAALVFGARYLPVPVSIDGTTRTAPLGVTVDRLRSDGLVSVRDGDLLAAKDRRVLRERGGTALVIDVDGKPADPETRVWPWSSLASRNGTDVVESVITTREAVPIEARFVGSGPLVFMTQPGTVGLRELRKGEISGDTVGSSTLIQPVPAVFMRTRPGAAAGRVIALTFDDGPWPVTTDKVLAVLRKFKVKATFFMVGRQVRQRPAMVRAVLADGNEIGSHSWSHKVLGTAPQRTVAYEIQAGQQAVAKVTKVWPAFFRPPYGSVSRIVYSEAAASKTKLILWDIDPQDWRRPPATIIANRVVGAAKPGAVVLMHDGGGDRKNTVDALSMIIPRLQAKGYRFVTLDQLFIAKAKAPAKAKPVAKAKAPAKAPAVKKP
jgi:peptidoglycan/xylan/chitin deacetylase (PgdA/CDA1 family)